MPEAQDARRLLEMAEQAAVGGDLSSADKLLREAARIQEAELGPSHPDLANTLNNLAIVAEKAGRPEDAETFYRTAAAIAAASLPADHPMVAESRQNLEDFCRERLGLTGVPASAPEYLPPPATPRRSSRALGVALGVIILVVAAVLVRRASPSRDTTSNAAPNAATATEPAPPAATPSIAPPAAPQATEPPAPKAIDPPAPKAAPRSAAASSGAVRLVTAQLCQTFSTSGDRWRCDPPGDPAAEGKIVFYTRVTSPRDTAVLHRWYRENVLQQAVKLSVRANASEGYRTYSRQTIYGAGNWRVEARSPDGELLQELRFAVR